MTNRNYHLPFLQSLSRYFINSQTCLSNNVSILIALFTILFLTLYSQPVEGYSEKGHANAARWALNVLKEADTEKQYEETYLPFFSGADREVVIGGGGKRGGGVKTLVQGAADEDYGVVDGNERSFRHYYNFKTNEGVRFSNLFNAWLGAGAAVRHPGLPDWAPTWAVMLMPGNYSVRYPGAKDWAWNGAGSNTLRTWQGAIKAYDYSDSSRQEAYWRLGHVVHLVADMVEPDHITNTPHWGSSFALPEDLDKFDIPKNIKAIVRFFLFHSRPISPKDMEKELEKIPMEELGPGEKFLLKILFETIDISHGNRLAGYEWAAEEKVSFHPLFADQPNRILKKSSFDYYFDRLAEISLKTIQSPPTWVSREPFSIPIGLLGGIDPDKRYAPSGVAWETLQLGAEALSQMPAINRNDAVEIARYRRLASYLISYSAHYNAGLIQWYYDIVNPPPFVRKVTLKQRGRILYEDEWVNCYWSEKTGVHDGQPAEKYAYTYQYKKLDGRAHKIYINKMLSADVPAEIIIEFGPRYGSPKAASDLSSAPLLRSPERILENSIRVVIGDKRIKGSLDRTGGIWTGYFTPAVPGDRLEWLYNIEIKAKDVHYHQPYRLVNLYTRINGLEDSNLDTEPDTVARVKLDTEYNWEGYEIGTDRTHQFKVHSAIATVDILSIKPLVDNMKELNVKHFHTVGEDILSSQSASELNPSYTYLKTPMEIDAGQRISLELEYAVYANPLQDVSVNISPSIAGWLHWSGREKPDPVKMTPVFKRFRMGENQTERIEKAMISLPMQYPTGDNNRSDFHDLILEVTVNGLNDHPLILMNAFDVKGPGTDLQGTGQLDLCVRESDGKTAYSGELQVTLSSMTGRAQYTANFSGNTCSSESEPEFTRLPLDKYKVTVRALGDKDLYIKPRTGAATVSLFKWNPRDRQVRPAFSAVITLDKGIKKKKPRFISETKIKNKEDTAVPLTAPEPGNSVPGTTDLPSNAGIPAGDVSSPGETASDTPGRIGQTGQEGIPDPRTREQCIRLLCPNCGELLFFGTLDEPCMKCIESNDPRIPRCMEGYNDY